MSDRNISAAQQQVKSPLEGAEPQQPKDATPAGEGAGEDRNAYNATVTAGDVTDAKKNASTVAQATVDYHFPAPVLEQDVWLKRDPDLNTGVFDPKNIYELTDSFKRLSPSERFNNDGWTPDLKKDMLDLVVNHIKETGAKGEFGTDHSHWQDTRTALRMAGQANNLDGFVDEINKKLDADPAFAKLDVAVKRTPEYNPWIGWHRDASTDVTIKGGNGNVKRQWQGFVENFEPHHTQKFSEMDLVGKFQKDGWTAELSAQVAESISENILGTGKDAQFGKTNAERRDARTCLRIAQDAGKLEETIADVNKLNAARNAPQLVLDTRLDRHGYMSVGIQGSNNKLGLLPKPHGQKDR